MSRASCPQQLRLRGEFGGLGRRMRKAFIITTSFSFMSSFLFFQRLSSGLESRLTTRRTRARLTASVSRSLPVAYPVVYLLTLDFLSLNPFLLRHSFCTLLKPSPCVPASLSSSVLQVRSRPTTQLPPQTIPRHPQPSTRQCPKPSTTLSSTPTGNITAVTCP